jgi:tetratricopeptide (TPR) repeat protein
LSHQPNLPVADKEEHQRKALSTYEAAIGELENAVRDQDERRGTLKGQRPREKSGLQNWADKYLEALNGLLRAHLCLNQARASLAKFLQSTGAPEEKWKPIATEAEKGYKQTLREFVGHRAAREGAVPLAEVVAMLGKDQEALERLHEVWVERGLFRGARAIPCEAQSLGASILLRLGRHREALNGLHEMVAYATRQEAPSGREAASANSIALLLLDMDEPDDPNQVGREALGRAFLLIAQVYGALGDRAKKDGKPTEEIRALFAQAHETALGVRLAGVRLDTPCSEQMDRWRREAAPPGSLRR